MTDQNNEFIRTRNPAVATYMKANAAQRLAIRTRNGLPDGRVTVSNIVGDCYAYLPNESFFEGTNGTRLHGRRLFKLYGYNISRLIPWSDDDGEGYYSATREIVFYTDPENPEKILDTWENPITGKTDKVFHIQNDPVNSRMKLFGDEFRTVFPAKLSENPKMPYAKSSPPVDVGDSLLFPSDIVFSYPLPKMGLPAETYHAAEIFDWWLPKTFQQKIDQEKVDGDEYLVYNQRIDAKVSWMRLSHWLPWMCIDDNRLPGGILAHAYSRKIGGYQDLPQWVRTAVEGNPAYAAYIDAPATVFNEDGTHIDNRTTWSAFQALVMNPMSVDTKEAYCQKR
jgi:hypothetical protein